jgi:hypothetical protein
VRGTAGVAAAAGRPDETVNQNRHRQEQTNR